MEGLLQAFAKEIAVVGGLISAFLFGRANPWLRATLAGMVAIVLAAATYFFSAFPPSKGCGDANKHGPARKQKTRLAPIAAFSMAVRTASTPDWREQP